MMRTPPDTEGVTRPQLRITDGDPHFLDTEVQRLYVRCRGASVRTVFVSFPPGYPLAYEGTIELQATCVSTGQQWVFDILPNTNQSPTHSEFGEFIYTNPGETYQVQLRVK